MCLEIYRLDPAHFFFCTGIIMESSLKNTKVKLELLTYTGILLIVENGIRSEICETIYQYVKTNKKYMEEYGKNKELSYLKYRIRIIYTDGQCHKIFL